MNNEWTRYQSFNGFPQSSSVSPIRLAKAGFYYTGTREDATCFCCRLTIGTWTTDETVSELHQRLSPHCRYLTGEDTTNVPIHGESYSEQAKGDRNEAGNVSTSNTITKLGQRQNPIISTGAYGNVRDNGSLCVSGVRTNHRQCFSERLTLPQPNGQIEYYPGITTQKPKHPDYAIKAVRLSSFLNWCQDVMEPEHLAEAGFYNTGVQDCVRCFFCGGGMKNWENGDNAWIEHARWFPNCAYVKQCKGENFVTMCRMANIDHMTANGEMQNLATTTWNLESCGELVEDQLIEDLNSAAAKLVMGMGYKQEDVEHAITFAREKYGSAELRAQYILESLLDNTYSSNDGARGYSNQTSCGTDKHSPNQGSTSDSRLADENNSESSEKHKLLEENRQLRSQMTCKICMDKDACIVFLPCGHMVSCVECAHALRKCAVCRSLIQGTVRAYPA
ncbi:baculoviral IAP repeat-containing protein 3-like [Mercenaria mercenaria]|uniref:baculoviral IAP repeat-containing protein 3-like n=1 Tax=Mercenaria mercenaria TaxID=6596 RepID=UPI00234F9826|nr:baculoviral IAP repeat-containing protein 3-like [Mercenaria mercenaria]XP_045195974.2 baculoviral IAP repeat-containing protein 3-like [Mercenaria mercenaria]